MNTEYEDYVSFETAKLLKEKGFEESCYSYYDHEGKIQQIDLPIKVCDMISEFDEYLVPSQAMAMKWLLKKYNIFICILYLEDLNGFGYTIENIVKKKFITSSGDLSYKEPEQAREAAIKYCLENLI